MNLELILILVSSIFVYLGYNEGFIKQFSKFSILIFSFFIVRIINTPIREYLIQNKILAENTSYFISFILILIGGIMSLKLLLNVVETFLKSLGLNFTNRIAGAFLGLFKSIFFLSFVCYLLVKIGVFNQPEKTINFSYYEMLHNFGKILIDTMIS